MATLVLIRHGQAGTYEAEYDQLSALGARQMETLGRYWAARGRPVDRAVVGPLVRQRRSFASFEAGLVAGGGRVARTDDDPGLAEYQALAMMESVLPRLSAEDPFVVAEVAAMARSGGDAVKRHKERLFQHVARRWVRGELDVPDVTPFPAFRRDVDGALDRILGAASDGETTLAFTSGGVVAAAMGRALGLDDEKVLELSWIVRNAAFTELLYSPSRMTLFGFNAIPHLDAEPGLVTLR
ncbi:MAG: hypothetical protein CVU56_14420 [Deltaproteobacteria bacterium HGW-Deltaproteobacteria-14]|nr:MAG: hypothetical protein CVU56_14420 [Deltaproteobacteria bacterium HGW-Deltaproteobacteria-14]